MKLLELLDFSESRVQDNIIHNVKVLGLVSKNKREYLESAVKEAAGMYEGADVYVNHSMASRKVEDKIGVLSGVSFKEDMDKLKAGLFAKSLILNPKHAETPKILWWAEHQPGKMGLSHSINGEQNDKRQVTKITAVESVDIVAQPATTNGFHESINPESGKEVDLAKINGYLALLTESLFESKKEEEMDYSKITLDELNKNRKDLVEQIEKPLKEAIAKQPEAISTAVREAVAKQKLVEDALAKVPEKARTAIFREQLEAANGDQKKIDALVDDRKTIAGAPKSKTPVTESTEETKEGEEEESSDDKASKKLENLFKASGIKFNKAKE